VQEGVAPNEWAPVQLWHRGALHLRYKRRIFWINQVVFGIEQRVAFAFQSRRYVLILGSAIGLAAAVHPTASRPCR
jgi:hypothetical protein